MRGYVLTGDRSLLASYDTARTQLPAAGARLAAAVPDPPESLLVGRLRRDLGAYADYLADVVAHPDRSSVSAALAGAARFDAVRSELDRFTAAEQAELLQRRARSNTLRNRSIAVAAVGLVVLVALISLLSIGAVRAIVEPIGRLQGFARELGAGRLDARLTETGPPETVELAHAFNVTAEELERAEAELRRVSERHLAELDAVFRSAPLGLAFVGPDLRFLRANDALAEMDGRPAAEHPGRNLGEVIDEPQEIEAALQRVIDTGEPVLDRYLVRTERTFLASCFPVRGDDGALLAVGVAVTDVTARRRAEAARERLQAATAALAAAVTVRDVARATVVEAGTALETARASLTLVERGGLRMADARGLPPGELARWRVIALDAELPSAECARRGEAVFGHDPEEVGARWPELANSTAQGLRRAPADRLGAPARRAGAVVLAPDGVRRGGARAAGRAGRAVRGRPRPRAALRARAHGLADAAGVAAPARAAGHPRAGPRGAAGGRCARAGRRRRLL